MQSAYDDARANPESKKTKKALIPISARFLLALLKSNDTLLLETPKENFIRTVREYIKPCPVQTNPVLSGIRSYGLINSSLYLAAEDAPQQMSLQQLSSQDEESCQKMEIPVKDLEKTIKLCKSSKAEIDIFKVDSPITVVHSCFHCSSIIQDPRSHLSSDLYQQYQNPSQNGPGAGFTNPTMALFNAEKGCPLDSTNSIARHIETVHRKGEPHALIKMGIHNKILLCRFCVADEKLRMHALVCCR